jgi:hypothetical protein
VCGCPAGSALGTVCKPVDRCAPLATVWRRAATFSSVCAVTDDDPEPVTNSGDFRCVIARDGCAWVGRTYGTYMPEEGAEARSSSLEGLKDEAQGQAGAACLQATGGHLSSSSWSYEYALGESTDSKLEAFRQARMAVWQAQRDREERGHQAAADLAAAHNATLPEIADILEVCCSAEAAELLDYKGVQVAGFRMCPHREERTTKEPIASKVAWWARDLADIAWDKLRVDVALEKLQEVRERLRASRT